MTIPGNEGGPTRACVDITLMPENNSGGAHQSKAGHESKRSCGGSLSTQCNNPRNTERSGCKNIEKIEFGRQTLSGKPRLRMVTPCFSRSGHNKTRAPTDRHLSVHPSIHPPIHQDNPHRVPRDQSTHPPIFHPSMHHKPSVHIRCRPFGFTYRPRCFWSVASAARHKAGSCSVRTDHAEPK